LLTYFRQTLLINIKLTVLIHGGISQSAFFPINQMTKAHQSSAAADRRRRLANNCNTE
jgi:hypothetical protein